MTKRRLESLSEDECLALLKQEHVGRIVYNDDTGPAAVPVNYAVAGQDIVFRSQDGSKMGALRDHHVGFEVDQVDTANRSGWSVLVRGTGKQVEIEHVPELLRRIDGEPPLPWKKGVHNIWVVITPQTITGRRLADLTFDEF